jgi:hypothetical protein
MNDLKDLEKTLFLRGRTFSEESVVRRAWCGFIFTDHFSCWKWSLPPRRYSRIHSFPPSTSLLAVAVVNIEFTAVTLGFIFSYRRFLTAAAVVRPSLVFFGFTAAAAIILLFLLADWTHFCPRFSHHIAFPFAQDSLVGAFLGMDHRMDDRCMGGLLD